jgi:hypothetical protein
MSLYKQFATSSKHETEGVWLDYGSGGRILIARAGGSNRSFQRALERTARKYRRQLQLGTLPEETAREVVIEVYADTIVLGWEGVTDREGKILEFSKANVIQIFRDLPELFADVQEQAQNLALFRESLREADVKN